MYVCCWWVVFQHAVDRSGNRTRTCGTVSAVSLFFPRLVSCIRNQLPAAKMEKRRKKSV